MCWAPVGPGAGLVRLASWAARCSTRAVLAPVHASCMQPSSACSLAPALLCACGCPGGRSGCQCRLPTSLASCTDRICHECAVAPVPGMVEARPNSRKKTYQGIGLNQACLLGQILGLCTSMQLSCCPDELHVVPVLQHVAT